MTLTLTSTAFVNEGNIPPKHTCDGENVSPAVTWTGAPAGTKSFVLIVDDPDVPPQVLPERMYDHWVVFNIAADASGIAEGGEAGVGGNNTAGAWTYTGPCPPTQYEPTTHRYFFKLYALDTVLDLSRGATKKDVERAMEGHVLEKAKLMGRYARRR